MQAVPWIICSATLGRGNLLLQAAARGATSRLPACARRGEEAIAESKIHDTGDIGDREGKGNLEAALTKRVLQS